MSTHYSTEVIRGIHQIRLPMVGHPLQNVNAYFVEGTDGCLLIDTGWNDRETYTALTESLKINGYKIEGIMRIVVTHTHPDHYGLAGRLTQLSQATLAFHAAEMRYVDLRYMHFDQFSQQLECLLYENGVPEDLVTVSKKIYGRGNELVVPCLCQPLLEHKEKISIDPYEFEVMHTPGHSVGHICLYERGHRLLFCGDHVLPRITPFIGFLPPLGGNPAGDYVNSLAAVSDLEINLALPGHGPIFSNFKERVHEILSLYDQRRVAILRSIQPEPQTGYQVASNIMWRNGSQDVKFSRLQMSQRRLAILECIAHLQGLVEENRAQKHYEGNIARYWAPT